MTGLGPVYSHFPRVDAGHRTSGRNIGVRTSGI